MADLLKNLYSPAFYKNLAHEKMYDPGTRIQVQRKQSFKKITTRTFYPGEQKLSIIVNCEEKSVKSFNLRKD